MENIRIFLVLFSLLLYGTSIRFVSAETTPDSPEPQKRDLEAYSQRVIQLESQGGAYSPELAEALLDLGHLLRSSGQHYEAAALFKRGAHLARIDQGLYSRAQIPLLEGEIASRIAAGDYSAADERQSYLYRIQSRALADSDSMTAALMQQAAWQLKAYQLGLGEQPYSRLVNMRELYRQALRNIADEEGSESAALLPPLHGLLRTHYLIADFEHNATTQTLSSDDFGSRQGFNEFALLKKQNYDRGETVIASLHSLETDQLNAGDTSANPAKTLAMLGDWYLYNGRRDAAFNAYQSAWEELAELENAQLRAAQIFGDPVALPAVEGIESLPPSVDPAEGDVLIEYSVSSAGRAFDVKRLDDNEDLDSKANRLIRALRRTKFRPRFEAGQPVETAQIVKAFTNL